MGPKLPAVIVRSSAIHAAGVYALERIVKGVPVVEYTGERIPKELADELYEHRDITYLFGVGDRNEVIDGFGTAMFINHSCDPNCETEEDEDGRVWVMALRDIEPGEELTYDYCLYDGDGDAPCFCGSKKCRGTMYAKPPAKKRTLKK
jgi:SET domain-containing protein